MKWMNIMRESTTTTSQMVKPFGHVIDLSPINTLCFFFFCLTSLVLAIKSLLLASASIIYVKFEKWHDVLLNLKNNSQNWSRNLAI